MVKAQRPVFGSLKLAPIKYEKSFVRRVLNKQDEGLFRKSKFKFALEVTQFDFVILTCYHFLALSVVNHIGKDKEVVKFQPLRI